MKWNGFFTIVTSAVVGAATLCAPSHANCDEQRPGFGDVRAAGSQTHFSASGGAI